MRGLFSGGGWADAGGTILDDVVLERRGREQGLSLGRMFGDFPNELWKL